MPTRYELAAELRNLPRGARPLPISKMSKSEIIQHIDLMKRIYETKAAEPVPEPAKRGPSGPRKVPVVPVAMEEEGMVIKTPVAPQRHPTSRKESLWLSGVEENAAPVAKAPRRAKITTAETDLATMFPGLVVAAEARAADEARGRTPAAMPRQAAAGGAGASCDEDVLARQVADMIRALRA